MKIIIIGNSGSGKTWLAERLAAGTDAVIVHLDDLFWEPGGFDKKRPPEKVDFLIDQSRRSPSWVVEGVFGELAERYFSVAETLIWLDIDWQVCRGRLQKRGSESKRHMEREQSEAGLKSLLEWASHYGERTDLRSSVGHRALLQKFPGKKMQLVSQDQVDRLVSKGLFAEE